MRILPHKGILFSITVSGCFASIALLGGLGVQFVRDQLIAFTPLLIALPAMNAMAGDYALIVTAHLGDPERAKETMKKLLIALGVSLPVSIIGIVGASLFIAIVRGYEVTMQLTYTYAALIAAALTGVVVITITSVFVVNYFTRQKNINSDDILIPVANSLASILTLLSFALITLILT